MPITHLIIHHLARSAEGPARLELRGEELNPDGNPETLFAKVKSGFLARISREHGSFSAEGEAAPLPTELAAFLDDRRDLGQLSATLMQRLEQGVNEKRLELDAHFLFAEEKTVGNHFFWMLATGHTEALAIDAQLQVVPSYAVDTGPGLFGIKVDVEEWRERQDYACLSLLPPRANKPLGELLRGLTGFANGIDKAESTIAFLEGVEAFSSQVPEDKVNDYRAKVVDYCMEQEERDAPVDVKELSLSLEDVDRERFVEVVGRHSPQAEEGVLMDRRSLRRYVKFAGREKDLAISFSSFQLNHRVHYDAKNDTLSINGLPSALRKQLLGHLEKD